MMRWLWLSLLVVAADQAAKQLAESSLQLYERIPLLPVFNLTLAYNEGAAFSFLSNQGGWQRWLFTGLAIGVTAVLLVWMQRLRSNERLLAAALALIVGGAVGNLIDRILWGHVIDFLDFHYGQWHWPAFNLADSAIVLGIGLFLLDSLRQGRRS